MAETKRAIALAGGGPAVGSNINAWFAFALNQSDPGRNFRITEIPVEANIIYDWTWENLDRSIEDGYRTPNRFLSAYRNTTGDVTVAKLQAARDAA